ncbi:MAG: transglycosylase SLT domain-containing protein [Pseudomonadota bacterium]
MKFGKKISFGISHLLLLFAAGYAQASSQHWDNRDLAVCDRAAYNAAEAVGVPLHILKAVARTESGITRNGRFAPWPWAVNVAGDGAWPSSKQAAVHLAETHVRVGRSNVDLGCFQINVKWHGQNFSSVSEMMDPERNANYAARFLRDLHHELGDWPSAIKAYHSRNESVAAEYWARLSPILQSLSPGGRTDQTPRTAKVKENQFPLLRGRADTGAFGSLFPKSNSSGQSLISRSNFSG